MHKSHNMSQTKITLPIILEHREDPGRMEPVRWRESILHPESARHRFISEKLSPRPLPDWLEKCLPTPKDVGLPKLHGPFDPWKLRDDFLTWPPESWESFIEMAGNFGPMWLSQNDFVEWQHLLREALIVPPNEWQKFYSRFDKMKVRKLLAALPIWFEWDTQTPTARIRTHTVGAIIASIQLDLLQGAQFRVCARPDCHNPPFKVEARQKIYCSYECAHLVAVRNKRARDAENKNSRARAARKPRAH